MSDEAGCRHGRYAYSPLPRRTTYDWPGARRIAVYLALNVECFDFGGGLGAELAPGGPQPDVLNYAWRDWGNRVGVFRLAELFAELKLPVSLLINAEMLEQAPQAVVATRQNALKAVEHGPVVAMHEFITVQQRLSATDDAAEGVRSFVERRPARFTGQ